MPYKKKFYKKSRIKKYYKKQCYKKITDPDILTIQYCRYGKGGRQSEIK